MKRLLVVVMVFAGWAARGQVGVIPDTITSGDARFTWYFSEGLKSKLLGNPDEAIRFFTACTEIKPEKSSPYYELGVLYGSKNDFASAAGFARNAWKRDPTNKFYGQLLIECLIRLGKPEDAIPVYRQLQERFPDNTEYLTGEITVLIEARSYKEALKRLKTAAKNRELERWAVVRTKDVYDALKEPKKGIAQLRKWLDKNPRDIEIRGILAESFAAEGLKEEALSQYKILKEQDPSNPAVSFSLAQYHFNQGNKEEALREYLHGFRSPDVNPLIKIEILKQFIAAQDPQEKLQKEVVELILVLYETDKGNPDVDLIYANYLYSEERNEEAEPIYVRLTRQIPGDFIVWQNLLFILNLKQDFEGMFRYSDEALKAFPSQGLFYLMKGIAANGRNEYETAISVLNKGLTYPGQNSEVTKQFYIMLGESYYRIGNTQEAFRNYDMLLGIEPDNVLVLNNYAYYLSLENRNLDRALEMITRCIQKEQDNPTYLDTYAWVLYKKGDAAAALEPIKKVMELDPDPSGEVLEHYGDILYANGMHEEAKKWWIRAKEKGETSPDIQSKIEKGLIR